MSKIETALLGSKTRTLVESFVTSKIVFILSTFTFMVSVSCAFKPNYFIMTNVDISSRKDPSTLHIHPLLRFDHLLKYSKYRDWSVQKLNSHTYFCSQFNKVFDT